MKQSQCTPMDRPRTNQALKTPITLQESMRALPCGMKRKTK